MPFESRMVCFAAAVCAFSVVYAIEPPAPLYLPLEHRWTLEPPGPGTIAMRWYGRTLWALAAAMVAVACVYPTVKLPIAQRLLCHPALPWVITATVCASLIVLMALIVLAELPKS